MVFHLPFNSYDTFILRKNNCSYNYCRSTWKGYLQNETIFIREIVCLFRNLPFLNVMQSIGSSLSAVDTQGRNLELDGSNIDHLSNTSTDKTARKLYEKTNPLPNDCEVKRSSPTLHCLYKSKSPPVPCLVAQQPTAKQDPTKVKNRILFKPPSPNGQCTSPAQSLPSSGFVSIRQIADEVITRQPIGLTEQRKIQYSRSLSDCRVETNDFCNLYRPSLPWDLSRASLDTQENIEKDVINTGNYDNRRTSLLYRFYPNTEYALRPQRPDQLEGSADFDMYTQNVAVAFYHNPVIENRGSREELVIIDGQTAVKDSNVDPVICRLKRQQIIASERRRESSVPTEDLEAERVRFQRTVALREIENEEWTSRWVKVKTCLRDCFKKPPCQWCCWCRQKRDIATQDPIRAVFVEHRSTRDQRPSSQFHYKDVHRDSILQLGRPVKTMCKQQRDIDSQDPVHPVLEQHCSTHDKRPQSACHYTYKDIHRDNTLYLSRPF